MKSILRYVLVVLLLFPWKPIKADEWSLIVRLNPKIDEIIAVDAQWEKLAGDFGHPEGPVWVRRGQYLLFSDIPANRIYKWSPVSRKISVFLEYSGFTGSDDSGAGGQYDNGRALMTLLGSNGVTVDPEGRIVYCAHGDRRIIRLDGAGKRTVVADEFDGKRLNSPNDLVYKKDGALYFTDPPSGLRNTNESIQRELGFNGVYLVRDGKLQLLSKDLSSPNGLAFSPDEKYFYVNDSAKKVIWRFDVLPDDTIGHGRIFIDMNSDKAPGVPDGMKVDSKGNVYCTGPGGLWIISPEGQHLGTILSADLASNMAFGGADGRTLYVAAHISLYQIRLKIPGIIP